MNRNKSTADWEHRNSVHVAASIAGYVLLVPIVAIGMIYLADQFLGLGFGRKEWKNIVMIIWLSALIIGALGVKRMLRTKIHRPPGPRH